MSLSYLACRIGHLVPIRQHRRDPLLRFTQAVMNLSYLACRIGHLVPIRQHRRGPLLHVTQAVMNSAAVQEKAERMRVVKTVQIDVNEVIALNRAVSMDLQKKKEAAALERKGSFHPPEAEEKRCGAALFHDTNNTRQTESVQGSPVS
jgi:hypothetical protein